MANMTTKLLMATALIAVAGCAKKPPAELPPVAQGTQDTAPQSANTGDTSGSVSNSIVPGSREDFLRSVQADRVLFATDSSDIDGEARGVLESQSKWLAQYPNVRITIEGHCDERGTREYNLALGERRANSAKNYLASLGVSASRINTISYGKERPDATGSDEGAWAQNRRAVTVTVE